MPSSLSQLGSTRQLIIQGKRSDGRNETESRPCTINKRSLRHADGSAIVSLGLTSVVAGVKAELAKPKAGAGKEGFLVLNVEIGPMCSTDQVCGPPSDEAQTITTLVERAILDTQTIRLQDLCIVPEHLVWVLYLDVICIHDDGGVLPAAILAATSALQCTKLPYVDLDVETGVKKVDTSDDESYKPLPVHASPVALSFAVFGSVLLTDPTREEGGIADGMLTVVAGGDTSIPIYSPGCPPLPADQLVNCIAATKKYSKYFDIPV